MRAGTDDDRQLQLFTILHIKKQSVHYRILRSYKDTLHDLRAGIWDRRLKPNTKTNVVVSVAGGVAVFVWGLIKFAALGAGIAVLQAVIMGVCTWVLCFALLQLSMKAYKKRHAELENPKEDDDENE